MDIIKCCICKKEKGKNSFSIFHERLNRTCNDCRNYNNEWYKKNTNGYKSKRQAYYIRTKVEHGKRAYRNHIKRKYGLTIDELNKRLLEQGNKCLICKRDFATLNKWNAACIDHSHETGKIRGILCRKCNLTLAYIENFNLWKSAIEYLRINEVKDKEPS